MGLEPHSAQDITISPPAWLQVLPTPCFTAVSEPQSCDQMTQQPKPISLPRCSLTLLSRKNQKNHLRWLPASGTCISARPLFEHPTFTSQKRNLGARGRAGGRMHKPLTMSPFQTYFRAGSDAVLWKICKNFLVLSRNSWV